MNITSERTGVRLPPTPASSAAPRFDPAAQRHASETMDIGVGESLTAADLLRVLDGLRRELSRHLIGMPGAFIGYDSLTLPRRAVPGPGRVIVEARLLRWTERLHDVGYIALSVANRTEHPAEGELVLARGTGRTLHVHC